MAPRSRHRSGGPARSRTAAVRPNGTPMAREVIDVGMGEGPGVGRTSLAWALSLERVTGIEPALSAWEADVLPLNYTRERASLYPIPRPL